MPLARRPYKSMAADECRGQPCYGSSASAAEMTARRDAHLDADEVTAFLAGCLDAAGLERLERHVAQCRECRELLSELARHQTALPPTTPTLVAGRSDGGFMAGL